MTLNEANARIHFTLENDKDILFLVVVVVAAVAALILLIQIKQFETVMAIAYECS